VDGDEPGVPPRCSAPGTARQGATPADPAFHAPPVLPPRDRMPGWARADQSLLHRPTDVDDHGSVSAWQRAADLRTALHARTDRCPPAGAAMLVAAPAHPDINADVAELLTLSRALASLTIMPANRVPFTCSSSSPLANCSPVLWGIGSTAGPFSSKAARSSRSPDMDYPIPEAVRRALHKLIEGADLGYPDWPNGTPECRRRRSDYHAHLRQQSVQPGRSALRRDARRLRPVAHRMGSAAAATSRDLLIQLLDRVTNAATAAGTLD
jgi:hypothetical protein